MVSGIQRTISHGDITEAMWDSPREILRAFDIAGSSPAPSISVLFRKCINYPRLREASFWAWIKPVHFDEPAKGLSGVRYLSFHTDEEQSAIKNFTRLESALQECGFPFQIKKERWDLVAEVKGLKPLVWDFARDFGRVDYDLNRLKIGTSAEFLVPRPLSRH